MSWEISQNLNHKDYWSEYKEDAIAANSRSYFYNEGQYGKDTIDAAMIFVFPTSVYTKTKILANENLGFGRKGSKVQCLRAPPLEYFPKDNFSLRCYKFTHTSKDLFFLSSHIKRSYKALKCFLHKDYDTAGDNLTKVMISILILQGAEVQSFRAYLVRGFLKIGKCIFFQGAKIYTQYSVLSLKL